MGLGWTSYLRSLEQTSVASAGVVYMSYPLFVVLIAWLLFRHRVQLRSAISVLLIIAAALVAYAPTGLSPADWRNLAACLPAPVGFGLIVVLVATVGRDFSTMERWSCVATGAVLGLLPLSLALEPQGLLPVRADAWIWVAAMALITAAVPQMIYSLAAPRVGPARAAAAGTTELPTMFVVGWVAFAEVVTMAQILAGALIMLAVFVAPVITDGPRPPYTRLRQAASAQAR
jgi:drug/metabolite transporter (DMT)-like permease